MMRTAHEWLTRKKKNENNKNKIPHDSSVGDRIISSFSLEGETSDRARASASDYVIIVRGHEARCPVSRATLSVVGNIGEREKEKKMGGEK